MNTVPDKVMQLVKAQLLHDRKQNEERSRMSPEELAKTPKVDYLTPIIADADAGFGGITSVLKLAKLFIEAGAAGIHIEDQKPGVKKCGHLGGKTLVSVREHITRLQAARLMSDIMGADLILVARTDSLSANFLDNNIDVIDHPFILGVIDAKDDSKTGTFPDAGRAAIKAKFTGAQQQRVLAAWNERCLDISLPQGQKLAEELGFTFYFDWEATRTDEGYYRTAGCVEYSIRRAIAVSPYADLIWMETPNPDLSMAKAFADGVHAARPNQMLAYNLSPSFNWDAKGMSDEEIEQFIPNLAQMGYVWQFITLAGFHMDALISEVFTRQFAKDNMLAYVQNIQRAERREGVDQLTHQKWSGVNLLDRTMQLASDGKVSTQAGKGSTESQFGGKSKI